MLEFASQHALLVIPAFAALALFAINYGSLAGLIRRNKSAPTGPAKRIIENADAILDQAWRLTTPAERNATQDLADKIKHISQQSMLEAPEEQ